jgi:hypothetical protein
MRADDVSAVIRALLDPNDPDHVDLQRSASPPTAVSEVVKRKGVGWQDKEVRMLAHMLMHPSTTETARWVRSLSHANQVVQEASRAVRPAHVSLLVIHTTTFVLGLSLMLVGAATAILDRPEGGGNPRRRRLRDPRPCVPARTGTGHPATCHRRRPARDHPDQLRTPTRALGAGARGPGEHRSRDTRLRRAHRPAT